jgi:O-methyltransferase
MKLTKLQNWLKTKGIAARRFRILSDEEKSKISSPYDYDVYQSELIYCPWQSDAIFSGYFSAIKNYTLNSSVRCYIIYSLFRQCASLDGEIWECGVYKGGTALLMKLLRDDFMRNARVCLFDSFKGMPETHVSRDVHKAGDFADTSLESVKRLVGIEGVAYHAGFIPSTFEGLNSDAIAFAHIDLDLYDAILESCKFIYPRLLKGGVMVFDDYGFPSCPGARKAVDEFFSEKPEFPVVMPSGQCFVVKN